RARSRRARDQRSGLAAAPFAYRGRRAARGRRPCRPRRRGVTSTNMTTGVACALSPLVRRIVAPNPGPMTGPGTNTYLVGVDEVAVIDPGPDDAGHLDAVADCGGDRVRWILVTHTHSDHAPGAAGLKQRTGAEVLGYAE